jgi:DNA-binding NarL/FixJ family response regulator
MRRVFEASALPAPLPGSVDSAALRLIVLSDVRLLRDGLVQALSGAAGLDVVGEADLLVAPDQIAFMDPDALLLDASGADSFGRMRLLRAALPDLRIVAFGVDEADEAMMAWAEAGAAAFVAPGASAKDLIAVVRDAMRGELVCSPRAAGLLLSRLRALAAPKPDPCPDRYPLTRRERQIAQLMRDGLSNKQIARRLGIQSATVKNHVHSILAKLHLSRRGEVAAQLEPKPARRLSDLLGGAAIGREIKALAAA